jgi:hypothetical protein
VDPTARPDIVVRSHLLAAALFAGAALGLAVVALGGLVYAEDASRTGEEWDGLGLWIGAIMVGAGSAWTAAHLALWFMLVGARRSFRADGDVARLGRVGTTCAVLGAVLCLLMLAYWLTGGADLAILLVPIGTTASVAVAGRFLAAAARSRWFAMARARASR